MNTLFVFAGEHSGDLHGEKILLALKERDPSLNIVGVGGPRMRQAGLKCLIPMEEFQVMGFVDVFLALPRLIRLFYRVARLILSSNPRMVIFIDYPGFNLRMAQHLRKKKFTGLLCQYICPSVWAWGKSRVHKMSKTLNLLLTILPFEGEYFKDSSLKVVYVGHPLIQRIKEHVSTSLELPANKTVIALFPGSRHKEIERNLPIQLAACEQLHISTPNLHFAISLADKSFLPDIQEIVRFHSPALSIQYIPSHRNYDLMRTAHMAIAKSGTVTLELALHQVPTVVTYAISTLDLFIAQHLFQIRLPHYCLVNIIAGKEVFPELFGPHFTKKNLLKKAKPFLHPSSARRECMEACSALTTLLGKQNASDAAAQIIMDAL